MFHLPNEIVQQIFTYDPTFHRVYGLVLREICTLRLVKGIRQFRRHVQVSMELKRHEPVWRQRQWDEHISRIQYLITMYEDHLSKERADLHVRLKLEDCAPPQII